MLSPSQQKCCPDVCLQSEIIASPVVVLTS